MTTMASPAETGPPRVKYSELGSGYLFPLSDPIDKFLGIDVRPLYLHTSERRSERENNFPTARIPGGTAQRDRRIVEINITK